MCTVPLILFSLLAQLAPIPAAAESKAKAQAMLTEGSTLYERGDYAGALEKFNAAYAAYPSPKLMFNIGQADRDLGRPVEALAAFERFLVGDSNSSPETSADARKSVAELQERLGRIRVDCKTPGAEVSIDGRRAGITPLSRFIWATPGPHQLTAKNESGALALENVEVIAGSVQTVPLRLHSPSPAGAAASPSDTESVADAEDGKDLSPGSETEGGSPSHKWTWIAAGATTLLAGGAITAGLSMKSKFDSLDKSCGSSSGSPLGCNDSEIAGLTSRRNMANALWGLTGAAAVTTVVLFFVEGRPVAIAPMAGETTGVQVAVRY